MPLVKNPGDIHSKDLYNELQKMAQRFIIFLLSRKLNVLLENCIPGDLLITMGAGDVSMIGEELRGNSYPHYPQSCQHFFK